MDQKNIVLISFGYFGKASPGLIAKSVEHEFSIPVVIREGHLDLSEFYDVARGQYNGNNLLNKIDQIYASDSAKTLGIFNVDLFIPILTYIFGQAFLNGRTGIASIYRLSNETLWNCK
jgi:archaemetzincin